jgi:hypothetical protein
MAKEVLRNATLLVNGVNLSDHCSSITLEDSAAEVDFTAFGSGYQEFGQGLRDSTITADLYNDHAASSVADSLQPLYESGGTFAVVVKPDLAGTVKYTQVSRLFTNPLLSGGVGDANTVSVTFRNGGTAGVVRGSAAAGATS